MKQSSYFLSFVVLSLAPFVSGCGTYVPEIKEAWDTESSTNLSANGVLEFRVKKKVYCAIYEAVQAQTNLPRGWAVQSTIDLQADETGGVNPSGSYILPFNAAEGFTLGIGANISSQATQQHKYGSYWDLDRLKVNKTTECNNIAAVHGNSPLITNELGLTQWLSDSLANNNFIQSSPLSKDNTFNQDSLTLHIRFVVITTGTLNPSFKLVRFTVNDSGPLASVNRTRTHDILLTFGPKFKPNTPNVAQIQHSATEYGISTANSIEGRRLSPFPF